MRLYEVPVTVTTTYLVEADNIPDAYEQLHNYDNYICVLHEEEVTGDVKRHDEKKMIAQSYTPDWA